MAKIHFPKGEGFKIIKQASEATVPDSVYFHAINETFAEMIIVSKSGKKRTIGFSLPDNIATTDLFDDEGNVTKEGTVYLKSQIPKTIDGVWDFGEQVIANRLIVSDLTDSNVII